MTSKSPSPPSHLLLLDLDGVVVFEHGPPHFERLEILKLHQELHSLLSSFGAPIVVLTHRSRAEAARIFEAAGVPMAALSGVIAAEDLALASFKHNGLGKLATRGLRKSLALPLVEARTGVPRLRIALIDDRMDNLEDMIEAGLGLAMHAPSSIEANGALGTFDMTTAIAEFRKWTADGTGPRLVNLPMVALPVEPWRRTNLHTRKEGAHVFNYLRALARFVRRGLQRLSR